MVKRPSIAAIIWFLAFFVVSTILLRSLWVTSDEPSDVIFDNKVFYDSGQTAVGDGVVSISGTLTEEGVGNKNNTVTVTCYQDRMECLAYSIAQIGPNQLGKLDVPGIFPITKWDNYEIVAVESGDTVACRKATVSIERKTETAVWVEDPINQTQPACKETHTKTYRWTIEDPPLEAQQKVNPIQSRRFSVRPMTLGNMRELGVQRLMR